MIDEINRVLKPKGKVYIDCAFMQSFHGYPNHYQNFTLSGLRFLIRDFKEIDIGIVSGPASAICSMITRMIILLPINKYIRYIFQFIVGWCVVFPLRYFDRILIKNPRAIESALSIFLIEDRNLYMPEIEHSQKT